MQDVSVLPLWRCLERRGKPDVYVTEYFRVHGNSHPERHILRSIQGPECDDGESRPVIAQLMGSDPVALVRTALYLQDHTPCTGIDVNLGCPSPTVCGKTAGGGLLRELPLIREIVERLRPVVRCPLTLKTRLGYESPEEFGPLLDLFADLPLDGITIHARSVRERYRSEVHISAIAESVLRLPYPVIANGSIVSAAVALRMLEITGAAGLMIGRGAIRDPWIFASIRAALRGEAIPRPRMCDLLSYIEELAEELRREGSFSREIDWVNRMKKFTNYIASGIAGGRLVQELRRATDMQAFRESARTHLANDEVFPAEPEEDGTLFCGFRALSLGSPLKNSVM